MFGGALWNKQLSIDEQGTGEILEVLGVNAIAERCPFHTGSSQSDLGLPMPDVITVPGALEVPAVVALAEDAGGHDGYVALGVVIRGETHHFDIVANESARGLMDLAIAERLAVGNGILTVEDEDQAWARARVGEGDKGGGAAKACLDMIAIKRRFAEQSR